MLIILRSRTKRRLVLGFRLLITLFIFSLVFAHLYNIYHGNNLIEEGRLWDDRPSGNPIRVENSEQAAESKDPGVLDQFVVRLRDFYQRDQ